MEQILFAELYHIIGRIRLVKYFAFFFIVRSVLYNRLNTLPTVCVRLLLFWYRGPFLYVFLVSIPLGSNRFYSMLPRRCIRSFQQKSCSRKKKERGSIFVSFHSQTGLLPIQPDYFLFEVVGGFHSEFQGSILSSFYEQLLRQ